MHRICGNLPDPKEDIWITRLSPSFYRREANFIKMVLSKPSRFKLSEQKKRKLAKVLEKIATDATDKRAVMYASTALLKIGVDLERLQLAQEQFEDQKHRLDAGLPTQILSDPARFQTEADSLLIEVSGSPVQESGRALPSLEADQGLPGTGEEYQD